jgi:hypothetical protein
MLIAMGGHLAFGHFYLTWLVAILCVPGVLVARRLARIGLGFGEAGLVLGAITFAHAIVNYPRWMESVSEGLFTVGLFWGPLLGLSVVAIVRARRAIRASADGVPRCRNCGYILTGLSRPRCPECGTPFLKGDAWSEQNAQQE